MLVIFDSVKEKEFVALSIGLYLRPVESGPAQTSLTWMTGEMLELPED
jgi:hypothetical protein